MPHTTSLQNINLNPQSATPFGGGGRPTLAQAGGKDASKLYEVLGTVVGWVEEKLK